MKYEVYSIRDVKGEFWSPRIEVNEPSAIRSFGMFVNANEGVISQYPKDFDLYKIGYFESDTGVLEPLKIIKLVVNGDSIKGV